MVGSSWSQVREQDLSNPLYVGSTATTPSTTPLNISQVLLSPPKATCQDLAWAPLFQIKSTAPALPLAQVL